MELENIKPSLFILWIKKLRLIMRGRREGLLKATCILWTKLDFLFFPQLLIEHLLCASTVIGIGIQQ